MTLSYPTGFSVALDHLMIALQVLDTLDAHTAAAHVMTAIDCINAAAPIDTHSFILDLNSSVDFSFLDYQSALSFK